LHDRHTHLRRAKAPAPVMDSGMLCLSTSSGRLLCECEASDISYWYQQLARLDARPPILVTVTMCKLVSQGSHVLDAAETNRDFSSCTRFAMLLLLKGGNHVRSLEAVCDRACVSAPQHTFCRGSRLRKINHKRIERIEHVLGLHHLHAKLLRPQQNHLTIQKGISR
jgi:hypothetical protein